MTKSETAPLRAGGRWALGLWIYRSRLIVYPGYTYILRIVTRHMVMHPGMYNHTRVCIITHTTTTISRRHQCDSHDSHVNVRHHTGGVVIAKTGAEFGSISTSTAFPPRNEEDVRHRCESTRGSPRVTGIRDPCRPRARKRDAHEAHRRRDGRAHVECTQSSVKSSPRGRTRGVRDGL